jgi:hypothetical protein
MVAANAGQSDVYRQVMEFLDDYRAAAPSDRPSLIDERPDPTGDERWDALLAALVEHLAAADGHEAPAWAQEPDRFLNRWWFVAGIRALHASALVQSPISFARRGVFVTAGALDRV